MLNVWGKESAETELAAIIMFVPIKEGPLTFCIDYKKLVAITVRNSYPITRMDSYIGSLGDTNIL